MTCKFLHTALLLTALAGSAAIAETWHTDPITGCAVFDDEEPTNTVLVSWSGDCDESNRASGNGVLSWIADGVLVGRYDGAMSNGKANGAGIIFAVADGGFDRYDGEFEDNEIDGPMRARLADGSTFEGLMNTATNAGSGIVTNAAGDQYTGELAAGKANGEGHLITSGGEQYRGVFRDDNLQGAGEWLGENGDYYKGNFANNEFSGEGHYETPEGYVYEGDFLNGLPEGEGKFTEADGRVTIGQFKAGWPDGQVDTITVDGKAISEIWIDGKREGDEE